MKQAFLKYLSISAVISLIAGIATWPAATASFIRWLEQKEGRRSYTIPDLLLSDEVSSPRSDAFVFTLAWFVGAVVLFGIVAALSRVPSKTFKICTVVQAILGSCYTLLMALATIGLWY